MSRSFKAKYKGLCEVCNNPIVVGDCIYYLVSNKPIHLACGAKEIQPEIKKTRTKPKDITLEEWEQEQAYMEWESKVRVIPMVR